MRYPEWSAYSWAPTIVAGRTELFADVVKRLQRAAGAPFHYIWKRACEAQDRKKGTNFDPARRSERFSELFLRDLQQAGYDLNIFANNRRIQVDWRQVKAELDRREDRHAANTRGRPPARPPARDRTRDRSSRGDTAFHRWNDRQWTWNR